MTAAHEKTNTLLLLSAVAVVLAPHAAHVPRWVAIVCAVTLGWRAFITVTGQRQPPALMLLPLALLAMLGVQFSFGGLLGREAGVAMLVLLVAFKTLEMHARRDLFTVIFLCLFLVLTHFFHAQTGMTLLWMLAALVLLLLAQLSYQFTDTVPPLPRRLAMVGGMLLSAAPLVLLMLVLAPPASPVPCMGERCAAQTGLSTRMAPGEFARLALSDTPVFSVRFLGQPPPRARLYWRGPVLDSFDGHAWLRTPASLPAALPQLNVGGPTFPYEITLEPGSGQWLFVLELPSELPDVAGHDLFLSTQFELTTSAPITRQLRYRANAHGEHVLDATHAPEQLAHWLALPGEGNPRAREQGQQLRALAPPARVDQVLRMFKAQPFVYTLTPPQLKRDAVDGFLFRTRAGYCEHYAGAFVFLMRAAGVPARVVTGYQGGVPDGAGANLVVRQADAHAWAEVWLQGRGWVRVDPTTAVAPQRVQLGQRPLLAESALDGWRGNPLLALLAAACLLGWAWWWRRRNQGACHPNDALYSVLCQRLARSGLARAPHEGPHGYAGRIAGATGLDPQVRAAALSFLRCYGQWRYGRDGAGERLTATLKKLLSQVR